MANQVGLAMSSAFDPSIGDRLGAFGRFWILIGTLIFLAITKGYDPLLLIPIGFGTILANLPLGVFTVAIITVLYPLMSRQAAGDDTGGIKESFSLGIREIGYMMVPAAAGLVILSYPIIKVLFEHNNFGPEDTAKVSTILIFHSLGLVFVGLLINEVDDVVQFGRQKRKVKRKKRKQQKKQQSKQAQQTHNTWRYK